MCRIARHAGLRRGGALLLLLLVLPDTPLASAARDDAAATRLIDSYIETWVEFYPSRAFADGHAASAGRFENYSDGRLELWLARNAAALRDARQLYDSGELHPALRVDLSVLMGQTINEQADWAGDNYLQRQPQWFAEQVSQALTYLLVREQLSPALRSQALIRRLGGVAALCVGAVDTLASGNRLRTERAIQVLSGTRVFYREQLPAIVAHWPEATAIAVATERAIAAIGRLEVFLAESILPAAGDDVSIGTRSYAQRLMRSSLGRYDPQRLLAAAAQEIADVRQLMLQQAERWRDSLGDAAPQASGEALLALAISSMEDDRQENAADFLAEFRRLTAQAEAFVIEQGIASVPQPTTLYIDLSPAHFSGAAVGGVYPSGAFDAGADTLFYVPSIPDGAAQEARDGFYRSFNTHFNTMIISHEMFPGHYLQYKVAVDTAPPIRSLFPNGAYVEGWGSFVEELMLDAGWAGDRPLTRLAHLRKRLENATRAYVSVQVHTAGWGEDKVMRFAVEEGLLAPQFARNLWQRVVHSPLQITTYFSGYHQFRQLYAAKPPQVPVGQWVDAVLRAGPVPISLLQQELVF